MGKEPLNHSIQEKGEQQAWLPFLDSNAGEVSLLTMDINDCEGPQGQSSPTAQLPSHQLDNLGNLIIALFQKILAGALEETVG